RGFRRVRRGYASVNGPRMYYESTGPLAAKVSRWSFFMVAVSTIDTSFGHILPFLGKTREVIALDQQGHWRTADLNRPFTFKQSAADAARLPSLPSDNEGGFFGTAIEATLHFKLLSMTPALCENSWWSRLCSTGRKRALILGVFQAHKI